MCIIHAYKLWCLDTNTKHGVLRFREELLKHIAAAYPSPRTPVQPDVPTSGRRPRVGHWPKRSHLKRECVQCTLGRAGGRKSRVVCELCEVPLCINRCFKQYHEGEEESS